MSWVRLDDQYISHPKMMRAGPEAFILHVWGLCYCAQYLTDGKIPEWAITSAPFVKRPTAAARALVNAGLWHVTEEGFAVHDYLVYNPPAEKVKAERAAAAERMAKLRGNRGRSSPEHAPNPDSTSASPVPVVPPEPERAPRKRGVAPPEDFKPDDELRSWAARDFPAVNLETETAAWLDWCQANGRVYKNVRSGWKTWIRRAKPNGTKVDPPAGSLLLHDRKCRFNECDGNGWTRRTDSKGLPVRCRCVGMKAAS